MSRRSHSHPIPEGCIYTLGIKWSDKQNIWTMHGLWPEHSQDPVSDKWLLDIEQQFASKHVTDFFAVREPLTESHRGHQVFEDIINPARNLKINLDKYWAHDWKDDHMPNVDLWRHEYQKHGSCMPKKWTSCFNDVIDETMTNGAGHINTYFAYGLCLLAIHTKDLPFVETKPNIYLYLDANWNVIVTN